MRHILFIAAIAVPAIAHAQAFSVPQTFVSRQPTQRFVPPAWVPGQPYMPPTLPPGSPSLMIPMPPPTPPPAPWPGYRP